MIRQPAAWASSINSSTSRAELDQQIDASSRQAAADLDARLAADPDLSPSQRQRIMALAVPKIHAHTRATLESVWLQLQGGTVLH
jgi:hypothetical protein